MEIGTKTLKKGKEMLIMKSHYFFIRGLRKEPFVTVCLIEWNNKMVARGVSICSKKEPPIKKEGQFHLKEQHKQLPIIC